MFFAKDSNSVLIWNVRSWVLIQLLLAGVQATPSILLHNIAYATTHIAPATADGLKIGPGTKVHTKVHDI
jgi:hypothetical protein